MTEPLRVLIAGAGGHGQVVADALLSIARSNGRLMPVGFADDDASLAGAKRLGLPVLGPIADIATISHDRVIVGVGDNSVRRQIYLRLVELGDQSIPVIHPAATVASDVEIGDGTVVCAGVTLNPGARVGENAILNTGCIVEHHCRIAHHVHVAPGAIMGGDVSIGQATLVGIGAVILPGVQVGGGCVIGGGAVVTEHVPDGAIVIGVPARPLRRRASADRPEQD